MASGKVLCLQSSMPVSCMSSAICTSEYLFLLDWRSNLRLNAEDLLLFLSCFNKEEGLDMSTTKGVSLVFFPFNNLPCQAMEVPCSL